MDLDMEEPEPIEYPEPIEEEKVSHDALNDVFATRGYPDKSHSGHTKIQIVSIPQKKVFDFRKYTPNYEKMQM
jgi:hypothetical protein